MKDKFHIKQLLKLPQVRRSIVLLLVCCFFTSILAMSKINIPKQFVVQYIQSEDGLIKLDYMSNRLSEIKFIFVEYKGDIRINSYPLLSLSFNESEDDIGQIVIKKESSIFGTESFYMYIESKRIKHVENIDLLYENIDLSNCNWFIDENILEKERISINSNTVIPILTIKNTGKQYKLFCSISFLE